MIVESVEFENFKALRAAKLPLKPFTLLLGPNGSGKTSALEGLKMVCGRWGGTEYQIWPASLSVSQPNRDTHISIAVRFEAGARPSAVRVLWFAKATQGNFQVQLQTNEGFQEPREPQPAMSELFRRFEMFSLDPGAIARPSPVSGDSLQSNGTGLPAVLDDLKDNFPERWELLLKEMRSWLPEYDYIVFDKPSAGHKSISLRTKIGGHRIPASALSQGTLISLALLTIAYQPKPPTLIAIEEIDHGLHPRLLRHVQDALYRISYPKSFGETRPPIQVIATTHSPYLLDLYRDHPEEVVLANKKELEVTMTRLTDIPNYREILGNAPLSEVWYSGVLGGVPENP